MASSEIKKVLQASEERYKRLFDIIEQRHFIFSRAADGSFTYISPSVTRLLGYSQENFMNHLLEYLTENPQNREGMAKMHLGLQGQRQPPFEIEIFHKDGSRQWLEVTAVPVRDTKEQVIAVEGIAQIITERKMAEEEVSTRVKELEDFYDIAIGRELRVIQLKEENTELREALTQHKQT
ncbi:MAG: PAS domain S-box protein [Nitrospirota bacterium]